MKALKRIGLGLLVVIVLLVIVSFFFSSKVHVERSIVINTPASTPFNLVNDLKQWTLWSPWHHIDTAMQLDISEPSEGKGAWYTWKSKDSRVGNGKLTIVDAKTNESINTKLEFEGWDASTANYFFKEENGATTVTWTMESDMGNNPMARWMGLFMDKMIGADYEKGLANMKKIAEEGSAGSETASSGEKIMGFDVAPQTIADQKVLYITFKNVSMEKIGERIGEGFGKLEAYTKANKYTMAGPPFTVWKSMSEFYCAFPIAEDGKGKDDIKFKTETGTEALVIKYYGAYDGNMEVYKAMDKYMADKGYKKVSSPREVYITDPMVEKDTAKWLTEMVFPFEK